MSIFNSLYKAFGLGPIDLEEGVRYQVQDAATQEYVILHYLEELPSEK